MTDHMTRVIAPSTESTFRRRALAAWIALELGRAPIGSYPMLAGE